MNVLGLDLMVASETWEQPHYSLEALLESPHYKIISYCRGRDPPALRSQHKNYNYSEVPQRIELQQPSLVTPGHVCRFHSV